jgi:3-methyladenine DNA glycosylase AlkD
MTIKQQVSELLKQLRTEGSDENRAGMARYGINVDKAAGVKVQRLREIVAELKKELPVSARHDLGWALWASEWHEAMLMASFLMDAKQITGNDMERIAARFVSWDICDGFCNNLFRRTEFAREIARTWTSRDETFVRRAGFAMIANLAIHDKKAADSGFADDLKLIEAAADDDRNFVKMAVNWALRQIGKRSAGLNKKAVATAKRLEKRTSPSSRWIARDALKELQSEKVWSRLGL